MPGYGTTDAIQELREKVERYERCLRAITPGAVSRAALLDKGDFAEWVEEQAQTLLDGGEAECPNCCTPLHEGACVSEGEEDDGDAN